MHHILHRQLELLLFLKTKNALFYKFTSFVSLKPLKNHAKIPKVINLNKRPLLENHSLSNYFSR